MKIKYIEINNYKSFGQGKKIENIGNLNFFIGKNNSGKTNILKALKHFFDNFGAMTGFTIDDYNRQLFLKLNDNLKITIELGIEFDNKELDLLFFNQSKEIMLITGMKDAILIFEFELTKVNTNYIHGINSIKTTGDFKFFSRNNLNNSYFNFDTRTISFGNTPNNRYNLFQNGLNAILKNKFILIPSVRKVSVASYRGGEKLDHDCSNLNSVLHDLVNAKGSKRIIKEIEQTCKQILSFNDFSISNPIDGSVFTYIDEEGINLRLDGYGAGTEGILKIITLMKLYPDHIFGVEEPEVHIHPEVQRTLLNFLKEHFKEKGQIFITTHSSIFTSNDKDNNTFLVTKNKNNETEINQIKNREDFITIKNELGHKNIDLFFYDMIVLIEGDSEEKAFPIIANALNYDFDELGIKIINIKGKDKIKRIKEFLEYIKDSDVVPFIIVDKTKDIENKINDLIKAQLLSKDNYHIWSKGDFEDSFSEQHTTKAIKEIYGSGIDLTEDELREKRKNKPTVKIIEEKLYVKNLGSLNKPALGEELGLIIKNDIDNIKEKRQETEIEEVLHKIVKKL